MKGQDKPCYQRGQEKSLCSSSSPAFSSNREMSDTLGPVSQAADDPFRADSLSAFLLLDDFIKTTTTTTRGGVGEGSRMTMNSSPCGGFLRKKEMTSRVDDLREVIDSVLDIVEDEEDFFFPYDVVCILPQ